MTYRHRQDLLDDLSVKLDCERQMHAADAESIAGVLDAAGVTNTRRKGKKRNDNHAGNFIRSLPSVRRETRLHVRGHIWAIRIGGTTKDGGASPVSGYRPRM
jgi:hypothetical protein